MKWYLKWWAILIYIFIFLIILGSGGDKEQPPIQINNQPNIEKEVEIPEEENVPPIQEEKPIQKQEELEEETEEPEIVEEKQEETYLVTRIIDGDTIELENGDKVRYIGIDTPETKHPTKPVECYGEEASRKNSDLVLNKRVRLEKDISETDRYGRLLRYVYIDDLFINLELVKQGYALSYSYPPDIKYQEDILLAQKEARENERGLWSACQEEEPEEEPEPIVNNGEDCNIKGNISSSGEKIYHIPGCASYTRTIISEDKGEKWFCTEEEALSEGWRKALNCP